MANGHPTRSSQCGEGGRHVTQDYTSHSTCSKRDVCGSQRRFIGRLNDFTRVGSEVREKTCLRRQRLKNRWITRQQRGYS